MNKTAIILLHLSYWAIYIFLLLLIFAGLRFRMTPPPSVMELFLNNPIGVISTVPNVLAFYGFYAWVFPRFLKARKIMLFILASILVAVVSAVIGGIFLYATQKAMRGLFSNVNEITGLIGFMSLVAIVHGTLALVIRGFITWYEELKIKEELTRKNFETELALVKSQINPHFLFNTINNIDVLISKDAAKASLYLNKLSDIMRFMLYETKTEKILLRKELDYVERYIELQKIRTAIPDYVNYYASIETDNMQIAPMIFIPFVENAFKHAEKAIKTSNAINIRVEAGQGSIRFDCTNKYHSDAPTSLEPGGLGNGLIKKRLELLYPQKHSLSIEKSADTYHVKLVIVQHEN